MTIYADVFFLLNFICDFVIISLTFRDFRTNILKRIFASILGSIYSLFFVFFENNLISSIIVKLSVFFIMILIAHYPINFAKLFAKTIEGLLYSSLFCGIFYLFTPNAPYNKTMVIISLFTSMYFVISFTTKYLRQTIISKDYKVTIIHNKNSITLSGIYDSGNSLTYKNQSVIIISRKELEKLFCANVNEYNLCEFIEKNNYFIVPYNAINNSGVLVGFKPDKILINNKEIFNTIVCISKTELNNKCVLNKAI